MKDLCSIVHIHQAAFPGFFLTMLGPAFLLSYYELVLSYEHSILLVASDGDDITGFVSGFLYPDQFYHRMSSVKWRFAWPILLGLFAHPLCLPRLMSNAKRVSAPRKELHPKLWGIPCELSSIGVHPACKGTGQGKVLLTAFREHAEMLGAGYIYLSTDADQNDGVNRFYQRMGFELTSTFEMHGQRAMNEYCLALKDLELEEAAL